MFFHVIEEVLINNVIILYSDIPMYQSQPPVIIYSQQNTVVQYV